MLDRYWHGPTARISPEAPVPVVRVKSADDRVGGAGNVAVNIGALQVKVKLLGYCGQDEAGAVLTELLQRQGIEAELIRLDNLPTITKLRIISRQQQLIRLDFEESLHHVDPEMLLQALRQRLSDADVVVLSDYDKGALAAAPRMIELCREAGKPVLVDPKGDDFSKYRGATVLTPNQAEFEVVVGHCRDETELESRGLALLQSLQLNALLITRGEHGMSLLQRDQAAVHLPARAREVFDVTGAGDTVIAVLAAALAAGQNLTEATPLANLAAGIVVGKLGTASVSPEELDEAIHGPRARFRGVIDLPDMLNALQPARRAGEKIVVTNGCFDILHPGHVHYLQQAKALGDRLIVLVNSDASVSRLKGPQRPVNPLEDRMAMLAALECVDWVVPFDEDTPRETICRLLPDILVKGGDYARVEDIAGYDCVLAHGGEVKLLGFVEGYSTTRLIDSIRQE